MKFAIILFTLVLAGCCQDANASECNYIIAIITGIVIDNKLLT